MDYSRYSCRLSICLSQRRLIIPIFEIPLHVFILDKWEEAEDFTEADVKDKPKGLTELTSRNKIRVFIQSKYPATIVHEANHVKNFI